MLGTDGGRGEKFFFLFFLVFWLFSEEEEAGLTTPFAFSSFLMTWKLGKNV